MASLTVCQASILKCSYCTKVFRRLSLITGRIPSNFLGTKKMLLRKPVSEASVMTFGVQAIDFLIYELRLGRREWGGITVDGRGRGKINTVRFRTNRGSAKPRESTVYLQSESKTYLSEGSVDFCLGRTVHCVWLGFRLRSSPEERKVSDWSKLQFCKLSLSESLISMVTFISHGCTSRNMCSCHVTTRLQFFLRCLFGWKPVVHFYLFPQM